MERDDGGPAFPRENFSYSSGMTLRDWFAGQAMPAVVHWLDYRDDTVIGHAAELAYQIADAMLAERRK